MAVGPRAALASAPPSPGLGGETTAAPPPPPRIHTRAHASTQTHTHERELAGSGEVLPVKCPSHVVPVPAASASPGPQFPQPGEVSGASLLCRSSILLFSGTSSLNLKEPLTL